METQSFCDLHRTIAVSCNMGNSKSFIKGDRSAPAFRFKVFLKSSRKSFDRRFKCPTRNNATLDDFEKFETIGKGTFATVVLVKKKSDNTFYAMKILRKKHLVEQQVEGQILNARNILQAVDFKFIITLYSSFKDKAHLYMVMNFASGGEMFNVLSRLGKLEENIARFYASQVVLAIEYLHAMDIVYRDLKLENLILDERGYIQLVDFGCAKVIKKRTWSICGSTAYMAPEIVLNSGHNKSVDWWAFGVLLYTLVAGYLPFKTSLEEQQIEKIIVCKWKVPRGVSNELKCLLHKLLRKDASKRLGSHKNGGIDITKHVWFSEMNWEKLYEKEIDPPFKPNLQDLGSAENFPIYADEDFKDASMEMYGRKFIEF